MHILSGPTNYHFQMFSLTDMQIGVQNNYIECCLFSYCFWYDQSVTTSCFINNRVSELITAHPHVEILRNQKCCGSFLTYWLKQFPRYLSGRVTALWKAWRIRACAWEGESLLFTLLCFSLNPNNALPLKKMKQTNKQTKKHSTVED